MILIICNTRIILIRNTKVIIIFYLTFLNLIHQILIYFKLVCNRFFSHNYATLAKYGTNGKDYQILRNDSLFNGNEKAEGYFKHNNCIEKTHSRFCLPCASLVFNETFNKYNRHMQTFIVQIDCLFLLKEGQKIPQTIHTQFNHNSDHK